ncbi:hypothetical protein [Anaerococcus nagyae]|uniref:hypothetical protein n=1 Tax=Anaerococcus nagyae TaxID=1755241 RepID=UPI001AE33BEC|nr:hypothetical protein [Anaerococcus nagyae]MBP2069989.1 putative HTH domain antitoxin [Anaerococcus nagyae]
MEGRIISGETAIIEINEFEWQKNISSGEYLDIESIEIGTNNTISLRKKIPFYKYIINYMLTSYSDRLDIEKEDIGEIASNIFTSIQKGEKNAEFEKIVNLVVELFREKNLYPHGSKSEVYGSLEYDKDKRKVWKKTQIRKDFKASVISRDKMFIYGFGLGIEIEELEVFLMKVLEETGLNIWDEKEAMIYIALAHFPKNSVNFFVRAMDLYNNEKKANIKERKKETNLNTTILQNSLDDYINEYRNMEQVDDSIILNIIAYHKVLVLENTNRTILKEFISTFREVEKKLSDEISAFSNVKYGNSDDNTTNADYFSRGNVKIFYQSTDDIIIPVDTGFEFKSEKTGEIKVYYPEEEIILKASTQKIEKEVSVQSASYKYKDEVPVLGSSEEYSDFIYQNNIEGIIDINQDSIYISEKRLSSLLTYLYNKDAIISTEDVTLSDEEVEALDDLLKETRIKHENLNAIIEKGKISQITRPRLITLYFLSYVLDNEDIWFDKLSTPARRKRDYLIFMDSKLRNSRLYEYNISNPYEETLLKLVVYDEPIDAFRDLWAKYLINIGED